MQLKVFNFSVLKTEMPPPQIRLKKTQKVNRFLHQNRATLTSLELYLTATSHKYVTTKVDSTLKLSQFFDLRSTRPNCSTKTYIHIYLDVRLLVTPSSFFPPSCTASSYGPEPKKSNHSKKKKKKNHREDNNIVTTQTQKVSFFGQD